MTGQVVIQNFDGENKEIDLDKLQGKTVANFYNCIDCTFKISKKINAIKITNCDNVKLYVDSLLSALEITSSVKTTVVVTGCINLFTLDDSNESSLCLAPPSHFAQVYATKCTTTHLRLLNDNLEEEKELFLPEQFVFTLNESKTKVNAKTSELYDY